MDPLLPKTLSDYEAAVQQFTVQISERIVKPRRNALRNMIIKVMTAMGLHPNRFPVLKREAEIMAYLIEMTGACAGYETSSQLSPHIQSATRKLDRILSLIEGRVPAQACPFPNEQPYRLKKIYSTLKSAKFVLIFVFATNLAIIAIYESANRKNAEEAAKEMSLLRLRIEALSGTNANALTAINQKMGALLQQTIPDVITYQNSGGKDYAMLPDGTWKNVKFHNATPTKTTK